MMMMMMMMVIIIIIIIIIIIHDTVSLTDLHIQLMNIKTDEAFHAQRPKAHYENTYLIQQ